MADVPTARLLDSARRASRLLKSMSNPHRLAILCLVAERERSVGELGDLIGLNQSALSQHLARLRLDRLVRTRRHRQSIYYSLDDEAAQQVMETLYKIYCAPP
ncbi:MAG: ArsR/SmtB family transcription factor [Alphaproteobacteria bacterium]